VAALAGERLAFRIVADAGLYEALQTPHKSFVPLCDYETYQDLLAQSEISFMPLRDSAFNRCKSDLKFIEAAAHRVSRWPVRWFMRAVWRTGDRIVVPRCGRIPEAAAALLADPARARAMGDAARGMVARERMLARRCRSVWPGTVRSGPVATSCIAPCWSVSRKRPRSLKTTPRTGESTAAALSGPPIGDDSVIGAAASARVGKFYTSV